MYIYTCICLRRENDQWEVNKNKKHQQPVRKFAQRDFDRIICMCVCVCVTNRVMNNADGKTKTKYTKPENAESIEEQYKYLTRDVVCYSSKQTNRK